MSRRHAAVGYGPGDWFAVPLADGSFVPGRVAVHAGGHTVLGYLFAPMDHLPALDDVVGLDPGDALCACVMSGLRIGNRWPVLGGTGPVDLEVWRLPEGENNLSDIYPTERAIRVEIRDAQLRTAHSFQVPLSELGQRQPGGAMGAEAVENWFPHALQQGALVPLWTQRWWDHPTPVPGAAMPVLPPPAEVDDLVRIVVPGLDREVAEAIEDRLYRRLNAAVGEVDGTMSGPEGIEIFVYGPDGEKLAKRIRRIVRTRGLPAGTHLLIEAGDATWTVPLTR